MIKATMDCDFNEAPEMRVLQQWFFIGAAQATDGCWVHLDGTCAHGKKSWLVVLNLIKGDDYGNDDHA